MSARAGQPEVLAPAGSPAALDAALLCGAVWLIMQKRQEKITGFTA